MTRSEVQRIARQWSRLLAPRRRVGRVELGRHVLLSLATHAHALALLALLQAEHGDLATFQVPDALGDDLGWRRRALPAARARLLAEGLIREVAPATSGYPAVYRWGAAAGRDSR